MHSGTQQLPDIPSISEQLPKTPTLRINRRFVLGSVLSISGLLIVAHLISRYVVINFGLHGNYVGTVLQRFNMDQEVSIPTWWSQTLLLGAAILLGYIAWSNRIARVSDWRFWAALAGIFFYVSMDEGASLHELASEPVNRIITPVPGPLSWSWYIAVVPLLILVALFFVRFFFRLPRDTRRLFLISVVVFLAGSVGVEMISADLLTGGGSDGSFRYAVLVACEEGGEMFGVSIFLGALLKHVHDHLPGSGRAAIRFVDTSPR